MFQRMHQTMFRPNRLPGVATVAVIAILGFTVGCGSDSSSEKTGAAGQENSKSGTTSDENGNSSSEESNGPLSEKNGSGDAGGNTARDGKWQLGDAGQVNFSVDDGQLRLDSAKASSGWTKRITDQDPDEIEVHFTSGNVKWKFEAELEHGRLEISREVENRNAKPGSYAVGDAAKVEFAWQGSGLKLQNVNLKKGWNVIKQDVAVDEIEIDFERGRETNEFEAELKDGNIHLEISQKVTGPASD